MHTIACLMVFTCAFCHMHVENLLKGPESSNKNKEVDPLEPLQMNIYQSNTYIKDLSWLHLNDEPRVQEKQQVKGQQSYISVFVVFLTIPSNNYEHQPRHDNSILYKAAVRYTEIQSNFRRKKLHRMNQDSNFLGDNFSNRDS